MADIDTDIHDVIPEGEYRKLKQAVEDAVTEWRRDPNPVRAAASTPTVLPQLRKRTRVYVASRSSQRVPGSPGGRGSLCV